MIFNPKPSRMNTLPTPKKIVIADDHVSVREGLINIIESCEGLIVSAAVENGHFLIQATRHFKPDLVITDIRMPELDGLEAAIVIKKMYPSIGLVAYVADENDFLFLKLLQAGFDGIVLKRSEKKETVMAINMVLNGHEYFCNGGQDRVNQLIRRRLYNPKQKTTKSFFSDREIQVLQLICRGLTSKQMAEEMQLSARTIESYRESLMRKTDTVNTAGLVNYAYAAGIIEKPLTE